MPTSASWIDSHCHLDMIKRETSVVLSDSEQQNTDLCITIGIDATSNESVIRLCDQYNNVFGTVGIHPHQAAKSTADDLVRIRELGQSHQKIVAIGECGFDLFYKHSPYEKQRDVFKKQLQLALELDLPVVLHTRDAEAETEAVLSEFSNSGLRGVIHCFTSSMHLAEYALDAGLYLSFNGICTFPKGENVREVLKNTPLDRVLLETDAPFLTPVPHRGKENYPGMVSIVGQYIANYLEIPEQTLIEQVRKNTLTLFNRMEYES